MAKTLWKQLIAPKRPEASYPVLPVVDDRGETNVPGIYAIGELAGQPLVRLGLNAGHDLVQQLAPELVGSGDADGDADGGAEGGPGGPAEGAPAARGAEPPQWPAPPAQPPPNALRTTAFTPTERAAQASGETRARRKGCAPPSCPSFSRSAETISPVMRSCRSKMSSSLPSKRSAHCWPPSSASIRRR